MRTSILIVSYNAREHLTRCLESLARQAPAETEVIVVDNASRDGSADLVRERFPDCRLIALETNPGFGAANNRAAEVARGDALLLLNADAWLADDALEHLHSTLDGHPRAGLVAPQLRYPDGRWQFTWAPSTSVLGEVVQMARNRFEDAAWNHRLVPKVLRTLTGPGWYSGACLMVRRAAYEAVGGFDESIFLYFEDVDLCRRLRHRGWRLAQAPDATVFHVKGGSSDPASFELGYRGGQLAYYAKHRPRWEQRLLRRKLRRKFARWSHPEQRTALLALLDEER